MRAASRTSTRATGPMKRVSAASTAARLLASHCEGMAEPVGPREVPGLAGRTRSGMAAMTVASSAVVPPATALRSASASRNSAALEKRACGVLASARAITASSEGAMLRPSRVDSGAGSWCSTLYMTASGVSAAKGERPLSMRYSSTPAANRSTR